MIALSFMHNKEILNFAVNGREIYYKDRVWKTGLRCIPPDENFIRTIRLSRNKIPAQLISMFNLSEKDKEEYEACKTEEELAERIRFDCKSKGLIEIKPKHDEIQ